MKIQKSTRVTTFGLLLLVLILFGIKGMQFAFMADQAKQFKPPATVVTSASVTESLWESILTAVGSVKAVEGITVVAEVAGKINQIDFSPGTSIRQGTLLVQQDISTEKTQLQEANAAYKLAENNLKRSQRLIKTNGISQAELDAAESDFAKAQAQVENIETLIAKKTIRAPFSGNVGVKQVNIGQYLAVGDPIVSLQKIDLVFVNFSLPQRYLEKIKMNLPVRITLKDLPSIQMQGKITAFEPEVNSQTRNLLVQATFENQNRQVLPGMFVEVKVVLPEKRKVLLVPSPSISYAPYGNTVYIIEQKTDDQGNQISTLRQKFVRLGETRGDFVEVISGLGLGEEVVSTGVFKLRNGEEVKIDNTLSPAFSQVIDSSDMPVISEPG